MVGGTVIEVVHLADRVYINCADFPKDRKKADQCAIYVVRNEVSEKIEIGDAVWWQERLAYWTPITNRCSDEEAERKGLRQGIDWDIEILRIGFSGVRHPSEQQSL